MSIKSKVFAATSTLTLVGGLSLAGLMPASASTMPHGHQGGYGHSSDHHGYGDNFGYGYGYGGYDPCGCDYGYGGYGGYEGYGYGGYEGYGYGGYGHNYHSHRPC